MCARASGCARSRAATTTGARQPPAIVAAMQALPVKSAMLDGEGVICGPDGKSDFDRMRACFSRQGAREAFLYAFARWGRSAESALGAPGVLSAPC